MTAIFEFIVMGHDIFFFDARKWGFSRSLEIDKSLGLGLGLGTCKNRMLDIEVDDSNTHHLEAVAEG